MGAASSKQFQRDTSSAEDMYDSWSSKSHTLHIKFDGKDHEQLGGANPMRTFRISQGCVIINGDEPCQSVVDNGRLLWSRKTGLRGVEVGAFTFTKLSPYATGPIGRGAIKINGGKAESFSAYFGTEDDPATYVTQIQPDGTPWLGVQLSIQFADDGNDLMLGTVTGTLQTNAGSLDAAQDLKQFKYDEKLSSQLLLTTSSAEGGAQYLSARLDIPLAVCQNGYPYVRAELRWDTSDFSNLTGTLYRYDPSKESSLGDTVAISGQKIADQKVKALAPLAADVGCCTQRANFLAEAAKISREEMQDPSLNIKELMSMAPNPQEVNNLAFNKFFTLTLYHLSSSDPETFKYFGQASAPVVGKDLTQAEADLLKLPGVTDFLDSHAKKLLARAFESSTDPVIKGALTQELQDKLTFYFRGNTSDSACLQNHPGFTALMPTLSDFARISLTKGLDKYVSLSDSDRSTWAHKFQNALASEYFMNLNISILEDSAGSTVNNYATVMNLLRPTAKAPDAVLANLPEDEIEAYIAALRAEFVDEQAGAVSQFFQSHPGLGVDIMYDIEARAKAAHPNAGPVIDSLEAKWKLQASKLMIYGVGADGLVYKQQSSSITTSSSWESVGLQEASSVAVSGLTIFCVDKSSSTIKKQLLSKVAAGTQEWDQLSSSTARSIAMHGPMMYIAGIDYKIYKQNIETMTLTSDWVQAGDGLMVSIAISEDGVIYGVGTDGHLYMQSLSSMTTSSPWTYVAPGPMISVSISAGVLYTVGANQKVYTVRLSNMSQWTQISGGSVISVAVPKQSWMSLSNAYYFKQKRELVKNFIKGAKLKGTDTDPAQKQKFSDFFNMFVSNLYEKLADPKSKFDPQTKQEMTDEMQDTFQKYGCSSMKELLDLNSHLIDELAAVICSANAGNILLRFYSFSKTASLLSETKWLRTLGLFALYGFAIGEISYLLGKKKAWASMNAVERTLVVLQYVDLFFNVLSISKTFVGRSLRVTVLDVVDIREFEMDTESFTEEVAEFGADYNLDADAALAPGNDLEPVEQMALEVENRGDAYRLTSALSQHRIQDLGGNKFTKFLSDYADVTVRLAKASGFALLVANTAYDVFTFAEDIKNHADPWTLASDGLEAGSDLCMSGFFAITVLEWSPTLLAFPLIGWAFAAVGIVASLFAAWTESHELTPTEQFVVDTLVPVVNPMKSPDPKWLASLPPLNHKMGEVDKRRGVRGGA